MNTYINTNNQTTNTECVHSICRGTVIFTDVPQQSNNPHLLCGRHYYVVLSNDKACQSSPVLQVVPFSHKEKRKLPCHAQIETTCLPKISCLLGEQLTLIAKETLQMGEFCGVLEDDQMQLVENAVRVQLAIA